MKTPSNSEKNQSALKSKVKNLVKEFGEARAVTIVKASTAHMFAIRSHYPEGVRICCNSEVGGATIGKVD